MAKKKQVQPVEVASTAKKPLKVTSTAKKPLNVASTAKKPLKVASTAKKTSEVASTSKKTAKKNKQSEPLKNRLPESSNDEEDEPTKDCNKKNPETTTESESEAESESGSDETEPASTKTLPPATVSTLASRNKKRQSEEEAASTDVKRAKRESGKETVMKKGIIERVWTENDEIVLLQGMIDFKNDTGKSHHENMSGFLQMVKKSISFDIKSGKQFSSKIWSLRRKYVGKRKNGVERSFTKPHDVRCMELAKTIWGSDKKVMLEDDSLKIDGTVKLQEGWFESSFLFRVITDWGLMVNQETLKKIWSSVPVETKKRLEEKFMSLQATHLNCVLQRTELLNEVSRVMAKVD